MAIFKSIAVARKYEQGTPMRLAIDKSYRETQQILAIAATAALAPMLLIMFALKTVDLSKEQLTDGDKSSTELDSTIAKRDLK